MTQQNSNSEPDNNIPSPSSFSAQTHMGLAEVLQMCCLSRRSGQITFRSGASYGYAFVQQGRVLHAMCGVIEGEEAVYLMLSWPPGTFTLDEDILPHKRTIGLTWEQLLFEGARRADIGGPGTSEPNGIPVTTADPMTSTRPKESQPKLIISRPDQPQTTYEVEVEYSHVGRNSGNEICLNYPSVSNRHCIFVLSGSDIVLRDLNSSNGTYVNGEAISEAVLRPGDSIQIGVVEIKFEPGVKRPKLVGQMPETRRADPLPEPRKASQELSRTTAKLPEHANRSVRPVANDSAYVTGKSAISYSDLAQPVVAAPSKPWGLIATVVVVLIALGGGAYFYFVVLKH